MEVSLLHVLFSIAFLALLILKLLLSRISRNKRFPPSPPYDLPIVGHLHLLRQPFHRSLSSLAEKYGPVLFLWFGSQPTIIISSLKLAEECFTKNDIVLANRPIITAGKYFGYNYTTIVTSPYGDHWRNLRRVSAIEIFSTNRLNILMGIRRDEIRRLLRKLVVGSLEGFTRVELRSKLTELTFNIMMRMVSGKSYFGDGVADDEESKEFRYILKEVVKVGGASNPSEFIPILRWTGYGFNKRMVGLFKKTDALLQGLVDEHRRKKIDGSAIRNTMIDHLLNLQESDPTYFTDQIIKGLIMVMLLAGTDTSSLTLEWAMSYLVNHPDALDRAKTEIDEHIGEDRLIDEPDVYKLPYLQNIISETLRLKPAAPLLVPHRASEDCEIAGYHVPCNSMVLVNAWAIHRDPELWDDPTCFKPERFESKRPGQENIEAHKLIMPFGLGRRACPGAPLAQRVVGLTLGSLIQSFDWKRVSSEEVDLTEGKGLTMPKAVPLEVMCKALKVIHKLYSDE